MKALIENLTITVIGFTYLWFCWVLKRRELEKFWKDKRDEK